MGIIYHSRDELLFNLRWFFGPGRSSLSVLGQASFGFPESYVSSQNSDSFTFGIGSPNVLNPFVDISAIADAHKKPTRNTFLNAFEIESYLKQIGAFYFDQTVVKMEIQPPKDLSANEGPVESTNEPAAAHSQEFVVEEGNDMLIQDMDLGYSSSGFGTPADISSAPSFELSAYNVLESTGTGTYDEHVPQPPTRTTTRHAKCASVASEPRKGFHVSWERAWLPSKRCGSSHRLVDPANDSYLDDRREGYLQWRSWC
jgi:hypothetical protein